MTAYTWGSGFRAPKGLSADAVGEAIHQLPEPTPDALLEASRKRKHVLHEHLWSEDDGVWAHRARREECRRLIDSLHVEYDVGDKTIEVRAVEFLRDDGWVRIDDIVSNPARHDSYMAEIIRLQEQATRKMEAFRLLLKDR